jgi:hypothetical protein
MLKKIYNSVICSLVSYKKLNLIYDQVKNDYKSPKVILGKMQSENNLFKRVKSFSDIEFQIFSQFGDDGIIQYLVHKIPIPKKTFIEFGVENYREANTRFLMINNYWSGFIIDASKANVASIKSEQLYSFYDLSVEASFITKSNINLLLSKSGFNENLGILSIDIDGNDYWIWSKIDKYCPVIFICEYNSLFGLEPYTIPYKEDFIRGVDSPFNFYGTSLSSINNLSVERGYTFVGCNSAGNNAYFVKNEYIQFLDFPLPSLEEGFVFSSFSEVWDSEKNTLQGVKKIHSINNQLVYNTQTNMLEKFNSEYVVSRLLKANKLKRF